MTKFIGWFIIDEKSGDFLGYDRKGNQTWLKATKRGVPSGAMQYHNQWETEDEIYYMEERGMWADAARSVQRCWS